MLIHYLDHSSIEVLVVDSKACKTVQQQLAPSLHRVPRLVVTDDEVEGLDSWRRLIDTAERPPNIDVKPDDESKLLYTSGSSGMPKGVMQSHANIVVNVQSVWDLISTSDEFRFFKSAPDYHSMGILNVYFPLAKGLVPRPGAFARSRAERHPPFGTRGVPDGAAGFWTRCMETCAGRSTPEGSRDAW